MVSLRESPKKASYSLQGKPMLLKLQPTLYTSNILAYFLWRDMLSRETSGRIGET